MRAVLLVLCALFSFAGDAWAQAFPNKPIKIICSFAPGGTVDITARAIGKELAQQLGQPVIVDNRSGAGGNIGAEVVARSPADGYTLLLTWNALHSISPEIYPRLNYDPNKDLIPVAPLVAFRQALVVNPSLPVHSVKELIEYARAQPGKLSFASPGNGTVAHLAGAMFGQMAGINVTHIPYKGSTPALNDMISGQVSFGFDHVPSVTNYIKSGRLRILATTGTTRDPSFPDVPTMKEAGLANYETSVWFGLAAPAQTPREIVAKLNAEIGRGARASEFVKTMAGLGYEVLSGSPEDLGQMIRTDIERWQPIVRVTGAKAE